ncbi:MAG: hypothetical protein ACRDRU_10415, partial [Pseudonocardiaceae bacterium]
DRPHHPTRGDTMPTPTPQPDSTAVALCDIPLLDAEGTEIPLGSRVEQVAVNEAHGALRSRLHHHGDVTGRGRQLVYVCFDHEWRMTSPAIRARAPGLSTGDCRAGRTTAAGEVV